MMKTPVMKKVGMVVGLMMVVALFASASLVHLGNTRNNSPILVLDTVPVKDTCVNRGDSCPIKKEIEPVKREPIHFSDMEVNHVRVSTPGLFSRTHRFLIHLDSLDGVRSCFPLPGAKVISGYGARRGHSGVDLKTKPNDTIRCVFDGVVRMAKLYAGYGNVIVVRHDNGLESVYSHNSKNLVKSGDFVVAGQPIALTGRTGRATTEHLHFEFRVDGQHFNPDIIFNLHEGQLRKETIICSKVNNGIVVKPFLETAKK